MPSPSSSVDSQSYSIDSNPSSEGSSSSRSSTSSRGSRSKSKGPEKKKAIIHSKKQLKKNMKKMPNELVNHISSFVPQLKDKRIVNGSEYTGLSDERYNNLPAYAKDLAVRLKGYGTYAQTVNTLYRWYVYADQDWDKFIKDYPWSECVNIYTAQDWVHYEKRYPNNEKCYFMVTDPKWARVMRYDPRAFFVDPYAIKSILEKDQFYFRGGNHNTKRLNANMSRTRKHRNRKALP
jgi:hypothetical protein